MAMHHSHPSPKAGDPYRGLRIVAIFDSIAAIAMLLPCGIITHKTWPVLGVAPMFFSAVFQVTTIGASPRMPKMTIFINLLLAASLLSVLLPSWIFMAERRLKHWGGADFTMLGAYGTMPMMVNFVIHLYLALRAFLTIQWSRRSGLGCCCDNQTGCLRPHHLKSFVGEIDGDGFREPIMRFYDEQSHHSTEFQTSGFNTPRMSMDTLNSSV